MMDREENKDRHTESYRCYETNHQNYKVQQMEFWDQIKKKTWNKEI